MLRRNFGVITTLALTLSLSTGFATTHAATLSSAKSSTSKKVEQHIHKHKNHEGYISSVLKAKLGLTDPQIDNAKKSGKTAFDLAKEKGVTPDQLRAMIIDAKSQKIDESVKEGKISKEKADTIKARLKEKMQKWDGCLEHENGCKKTE